MSNFVEPAPSPMMISLAQAIWPAYAQLKLGNLHIELSAEVMVEFEKLHGISTIICANHPAAEDAEVLFGLSTMVGEQFTFLTARELFRQGGLLGSRWLQTLGCYSVERGTCDLEAFKATRQLLIHGEHKISIFPEGEVSYQNESLMEFENGPEQMALSAAAELGRSGSSKQICLLPLAIRYKYSKDIADELEVAMSLVEQSLRIDGPEKGSLRQRIHGGYQTVLSVLEQSFDLSPARGASLNDRIQSVQERMIVEVECLLQVQLPDTLNQMCRIHLLNNALSEMQWTMNAEQNKLSPELIAKLQTILKRSIRLAAVSERSFDHQLTQEEAAELLTNLLWETRGVITLCRHDVAIVGAGSPIYAAQYLEEYNRNKKKAIEDLKEALKQQIASRLQHLEDIYRGELIA